METDGHAPVLFHCSDGNNYFCKYRIYTGPGEINCLAFEIIATVLLQELKIPTPEIALVTIAANTLNSDKIKKNRRMRESIVVFGSREIKHALLVDSFSINHSKRDFNKMLNPHDIIRIALFDLWVKNGDRGRVINGGHNYNLLLIAKDKKQEIIAFDHAFIFGGSSEIGNFFPNVNPENNDNLYQTPFYQSIIKYIDKSDYDTIVNKFVTLLKKDYTQLITNTISQLPESWGLINGLDIKVNRLLGNKNRIEKLADKLKKAKS